MVENRPDGVSSIIRQQMEQYDQEAKAVNVGTILYLRENHFWQVCVRERSGEAGGGRGGECAPLPPQAAGAHRGVPRPDGRQVIGSELGFFKFVPSDMCLGPACSGFSHICR